MPLRPTPKRVLVIDASTGYIGMAFQDQFKHRQVWEIPPDLLKWKEETWRTLWDLHPNMIVFVRGDFDALRSGIEALAFIRGTPLTFHSPDRCRQHLPEAEAYFAATRSGRNAGRTPAELSALAHLLTHFMELEREATEKVMR